MNLVLTRDLSTSDCTLGKLTIDGTTFYDTIERPWIPDDQGGRGGKPEVSCVPIGTYQLVRHDTPAHPKTWALVSHDLDIYADPTAGKRSDCLIHPANFSHELKGCTAPGKERAQQQNGEWMVMRSREAMAEIQAAVPWTDEHTLTILSQEGGT